MLSLQSGPSGRGLKQQVDATIGKASDEGGVADTSEEDMANPAAQEGHVTDTSGMNGEEKEEDSVAGHVQYFELYCIDQFPMTYKAEEILYPNNVCV